MDTIKQFRATDVKSHRNGIAGRAFYSVRFSYTEEERFMPNMLAIMPYSAKVSGPDTECFVLNMNDPSESWRGDCFAQLVWDAIHKDITLRSL